jgi:hypothetical protein
MNAGTAFAGTKRLRRGSRYWILLGAALYLTGSAAADPVSAQQQGRKSYVRVHDLYKYCPPGHSIEFVVGSTPIYADLRWLAGDPALSEPSTEITGCPAGPLKVDELFFGNPKWLGLQSEIRADVLMLQAANRAAKPPQSAPGSNNPWVEDRTAANPYPLPQVAQFRSYRLHYPKTEDGSDLTVDILCASTDRLRNCKDTPYVFQSLSVIYKLTQPNLPAPNETQPASADPGTEPGALLQFDGQLREWINTIERKP